MADVKALLESRATVWASMQEIMSRADNENRPMTGEEEASYQRADAELDDLTAKIELASKHEARRAEMERVDRSALPGLGGGPAFVPDITLTPEQRYASAFSAYVRGVNLGEMEREDAQALRSGFQSVEGRALGVGTAGAGGYLVPAQFDATLRETIASFGGVLPVATTLNTDTGAALSWPTVNDTANVGAILAENTQVTEQDVAFGTAQLGAYKYTSKMVRVSMELIQDSAFDVDGYLRRALGQRIARIWNQHFTTGTGTAQPLGLVTNATVGKTGATGQTTSVTYDDLIDLIDSIDPAYQNNASFMMASGTRKAVRKLKDSTNRPLWEPSIQAGLPDLLLGFPYVINTDMPAPAANAKSILFGDFREAYVVRQVLGTTVLRLNELYANFGQVAFLGFARADGTVQNASAYRAYAHSAT